MNYLKDAKVELACRIGSVICLLTTGMSYSGEHESVKTTNRGFKLEISAPCRLGENQPYLVGVARDEPSQRRGIVLGLRSDGTEAFSYTQSQGDSPAEGSFELQTAIRDFQGNGFLLTPGTEITVLAYPAVKTVNPLDRYRIPALRTQLDPIITKSVTLPDCSS